MFGGALMKKVLIIEDDKNINEMLQELLSNNGYNVSTAYSGTEALLIHNKQIDLIILDLMLPGKNGEEIIKKLKTTYANKDKKIQALETNINKANSDNETELAKHIKLSREIDKENDSRDAERIQVNKLLVKELRKKQIFKELYYKYIKLNELDEKNYPHGIMILGLDDKDAQKDVINYLKNNDCNVVQIDFNKIPLRTVNKEFLTHLKRNKQSDEHSIIYIDNFDRYTVPTDENFNIISKLKSTVCTCSDEYNTTVLVFESNPERLDENIIGGHRFKKKIDVRNIKGAEFIAFVPKYDGYTMHFGADENDTVDLY